MENLKDREYNQLTVLQLGEAFRYPRGKKQGQIKYWTWLCRCECGKELLVRSEYLKSGHTQSCGCRRVKQCGDNFRTHGEGSKYETVTPEYRAWLEMIRRCCSPNSKSYPDYGGRGIRICKRWRTSYENFLADMGRRPSDTHSLDRKKVNGHYTPANCRWATRKEQNRNRRNNRYLTVGDVTKTVSAWAEESGLCSTTILNRINHLGWPVDKAVSTPADAQEIKLTYGGRTLTLKQWAEATGLPRKVLWQRHRAGWSADRIVTKSI